MTSPERAVDAAARLLARGVGLRADPALRSRLTSAVRDEAAGRGLDLSTYVARLEADPDALQSLLDRVTVQETSFFRDPGQFVALAEHVVPVLRDQGGPITVWSAGCANGQEAYSIAMVLAEGGISTWTVVATDISSRALTRTRQARYRDQEMGGVSPARRDRFFVRDDASRQWEVVSELRDRIEVRRLNLAADALPFQPGGCPVVFCRNVLIYFGPDDVRRFLERLAAALPDDGYLFLGYSESLWQVTDRFHVVRLGNAFVYRPGVGPRREPGAGPARRAAPAARTSRPSVAPQRPRPPRAEPPAPSPEPGSVELIGAGEAALEAGDALGAITAFRKATFVDPDHPIAHLNLGLALESAGDLDAARRAYAAALSALRRCDSAVVEATLEGYHLEELARLLEQKVALP